MLFAAAGLVLAASAAPGCAAGRPSGPVLLDCNFINRLGIDVLEDGIEIPDTWNVTFTAMEEPELALHLYALTDEARFYKDVSAYESYIRFEVKPRVT